MKISLRWASRAIAKQLLMEWNSTCCALHQVSVMRALSQPAHPLSTVSAKQACPWGHQVNGHRTLLRRWGVRLCLSWNLCMGPTSPSSGQHRQVPRTHMAPVLWQKLGFWKRRLVLKVYIWELPWIIQYLLPEPFTYTKLWSVGKGTNRNTNCSAGVSIALFP